MSSDDISLLCIFFFFSSRRRHTRLQGDWSSDVCSSDLSFVERIDPGSAAAPICSAGFTDSHWLRAAFGTVAYGFFPARRSEERRVGKEGRSRWSPYH